MDEKQLLIDKFYGGIVRDDKSKIVGGASNIEELEILKNADYIEPSQVFSSDSMPASTEVYDYDSDNDGTLYGYGKETSGNKVRIVSVSSGGADNPSSFSTLFTSADTTDIAYKPSFLKYLKRDDGDFLYYLTNASGTVKLKSFEISGSSELEVDSGGASMTLTGLTGSYDALSARVLFGELLIMNGQYIAKVDKDGVFTEKAFTLPNGWEAVDIVAVSDVALILCRYVDRTVNFCAAFWWDLTSTTQFDDFFYLPSGSPQWIFNDRETVKICTTHNNTLKMYTMPPLPGASVSTLPGIFLDNVSSDDTTQMASPAKGVGTKDNILYFPLNKTDKPGLYALGQLDPDKPYALYLSKRMTTSDYSNHTVISTHTLGPNFFASYDDNGTHAHARCESNNTPDKSSQAVYESIVIDDGDPSIDKTLDNAYLCSYPLSSGTSLTLSVQADYSGSYTQVDREDGTVFNTLSKLLGFFKIKSFAKKKVFKVKVDFTSSGSSGPKLTAIGIDISSSRRRATS